MESSCQRGHSHPGRWRGRVKEEEVREEEES